ncbi:hypothetical protein BC830DRAFT_1167314 [Chytriomyces sp. MP71]|nr:hypothetical protein BC830DRAFT_1167314 [Chytriomyces sp. MP71]
MSYSLAAHYLDATCAGLPSDYDISIPRGGCAPATCVAQGDDVEYLGKSCVASLDAALTQAKATWSTTTVISVINYSDSRCSTFSYYSFLSEGRCYYTAGGRYAKRTLQGSQISIGYFNDNQCTQFNATATPDTEKCRAFNDGTSALYLIQRGDHFVTSPDVTTTTTTINVKTTNSATSTSAFKTNSFSMISPVPTATSIPVSSGPPTAAIVGGVCGAVVLLALIGVGVWIGMRNSKNKPTDVTQRYDSPPPSTVQSTQYLVSAPIAANYVPSATAALPVNYAASVSTESYHTFRPPQESESVKKAPLQATASMFDGMSQRNHPDVGPILKLDLSQPGAWSTAQTCTWLTSLEVGPEVVRVFKENNLDGQFLQAIAASSEACKESLRVDVGITDIRTRVILANHIFNLFHPNGSTTVVNDDAMAPPSYAF